VDVGSDGKNRLFPICFVDVGTDSVPSATSQKRQIDLAWPALRFGPNATIGRHVSAFRHSGIGIFTGQLQKSALDDTTLFPLLGRSEEEEKGDFDEKSKFLNVRQRKNLERSGKAWWPSLHCPQRKRRQSQVVFLAAAKPSSLRLLDSD
jgi:hypothetical protein